MELTDPDFPQRGAFQWRSLGYHFEVPDNVKNAVVSGRSHEPWITFLSCFEEAKQGKFAALTQLVGIILETEDPVLLRAAVHLLGDAGSTSLISDLAKSLKGLDAPRAVEVCLSLTCSHLLWSVPILVDFYAGTTDRREAAIIPGNIAWLLGEEQIYIAAEDGVPDHEWVAMVLGAYEDVLSVIGDPQLPVFRGSLYSAHAISACFSNFLSQTAHPTGLDFMLFRHDFEACCGVDTRAMYCDFEPQPLAAAAIVEDFLESGEADKYEPGVRYFFGHRIPD